MDAGLREVAHEQDDLAWVPAPKSSDSLGSRQAAALDLDSPTRGLKPSGSAAAAAVADRLAVSEQLDADAGGRLLGQPQQGSPATAASPASQATLLEEQHPLPAHSAPADRSLHSSASGNGNGTAGAAAAHLSSQSSSNGRASATRPGSGKAAAPAAAGGSAGSRQQAATWSRTESPDVRPDQPGSPTAAADGASTASAVDKSHPQLSSKSMSARPGGASIASAPAMAALHSRSARLPAVAGPSGSSAAPSGSGHYSALSTSARGVHPEYTAAAGSTPFWSSSAAPPGPARQAAGSPGSSQPLPAPGPSGGSSRAHGGASSSSARSPEPGAPRGAAADAGPLGYHPLEDSPWGAPEAGSSERWCEPAPGRLPSAADNPLSGALAALTRTSAPVQACYHWDGLGLGDDTAEADLRALRVPGVLPLGGVARLGGVQLMANGLPMKGDQAAPGGPAQSPDALRAELVQRVLCYQPGVSEYYRALVPRDCSLEVPVKDGLDVVSRGCGSLRRSWRDSPLRVSLHHLLTEPESSIPAAVLSIALMVLIVLNTCAFALLSIPHYGRDDVRGYHLRMIEFVTLGVFTVEYALRLVSSHNAWLFMIRPLSIVDLAAILPFWVCLGVTGFTNIPNARILRIISLLRLSRLVQGASRMSNLQVVASALLASEDVLLMLLLLLSIVLVAISAVMYFIESAQPNSQFNSIPASAWFVQVTLTTCGYGDMVPKTNWGKLAAGVFMLLVVTIIALPISVIGGNFTSAWAESEQRRSLAERSTQAWPVFKELLASVGRHDSAMTDVLGAVAAEQAALHAGVNELNRRGVLAQKLLAQRLVGQASPAQAEELRATVLGMQALQAQLQEGQARLQGLAGAGLTGKHAGAVAGLDFLMDAYHHLQQWFEEGVHLEQDVRRAAADCTRLRLRLGVAGTPAQQPAGG